MLPDVVAPEVHFLLFFILIFYFFKKTNQLYNVKAEVHHRIVATYMSSADLLFTWWTFTQRTVKIGQWALVWDNTVC